MIQFAKNTKTIALGFLTFFLLSGSLTYSSQQNRTTLAETLTVGTDLKISADNRYLTRQDGTPFFWVADTVYAGLFNNATREDVDYYLNRRKEQRFNVIKVALDPTSNSTNKYGNAMCLDSGCTQPNPAYFEHVDYVVTKAKELDMYIIMYIKAQNAGYPAYSEWVGNRYRYNNNLIWWVRTNIEATVEAIAKGVLGRTLDWNQADPDWQKLLMGQYISAKTTWSQPWVSIKTIADTRFSDMESAYKYTPAKPVIRGDGCYEVHAWHKGPFPDSPYTHLLSGTFFTYGYDTPIWNFQSNWKTLMELSGTLQTSIFANFFRQREWWKLVPDQTVQVTAASSIRSARSSDGKSIYAFLPSNQTININLTKITAGSQVQASWFNPYTGAIQQVAQTYTKASSVSFTPPNGWAKSLLILDAVN